MFLRALAVAGLFVSGCRVDDLDLAGRSCRTQADCVDGWVCLGGACLREVDTASCPRPCALVFPRLKQPFLLDGDDSEYAGLPELAPPACLDSRLGIVQPDRGHPQSHAILARARVAWSDRGLHVHVAVRQQRPVVVAALADTQLWNGDAIELYAKGDDRTTGTFDGTTVDPNARQFVVTPAMPGLPLRAVSVLARGGSVTPYPVANFASRLVDNGYDLEALIAWSEITPPAPPAVGARVAFDLAIDVRDRIGGKLEFQLLLGREAVPGSTCSLPVAPYCDSRAWCTATLGE